MHFSAASCAPLRAIGALSPDGSELDTYLRDQAMMQMAF